MSLLLFSLCVNDTEDFLVSNSCHCLKFGESWLDEMLKVLVLMYAYDTVIMTNSEDGLCNALLIMEKYCDKWR